AGDGAGGGQGGLRGHADRSAAETEYTESSSIFHGYDYTHIIAVGNAAAGEGGAAAWGKPGGSSARSCRLEGAFFLGGAAPEKGFGDAAAVVVCGASRKHEGGGSAGGPLHTRRWRPGELRASADLEIGRAHV